MHALIVECSTILTISIMQKKKIFLLLLIIGTGFWGISFSLVKVAVSSNLPFVFLSYKFFIAAITLSLFFFKQLKHITWKSVKIAVLIGTPLLAGNFLQTLGLRETSVSNSAFITGFDVMLIPILKFVLYKKKVEPKIWCACILALIGLYTIVIKNGFSLNCGDIYILACAFAFAFYVLYVAKYSNEESPIPSVIMLMVFCCLVCFVCGVFDKNSIWIPEENSFWIAVLFSGILATAFMYSIQNIAQRYLSEEKVAMTYLFEPIFATIAGIVFLNEKLTFEILIGGLLIMSAMFITEIKFKKLNYENNDNHKTF